MMRKTISQSSSASTSSSHAYDVFLNFRGSDFRYSFVDCLYESLTASGICVFMDDEALRVGDDIGDELLAAIDSSRIYIPVFSRNYASSKWCLIELARMVKCARKSDGKEILPVFLDVEPEDVKLKTKLYAEDLLQHEERFGSHTVEKWRKALRKVSKMKGWNWQSNHGQGKLLRQIAERISHCLQLKHRILPNHFIGIEKQLQSIMDALDCGSRDVRIVVIHGMGGIGKTTLASAVFNKIRWQFQGCSFLSNVRESSAGNGIVNLQNKLLGDTLRFSPHNFCDENDAMNCIQRSLRNKDVLVVLDDVSDMDQIRKLIGMGDWVGLGSRVIITTRKLSCVANVDEIENNVAILQGKKIYIYQMRELGFDDSLQLLCRHAFGQYAPPNDYEQLSRDILSLTGGIPLALEVIGSYLKGKRTTIWKEILNKLKKVPHERLYREILMSSYETLCNEEKEIFLDIAFFFAGHYKKNASYYWNACDLFPETSVETLISYALVKIDDSNLIWMHDLLRDLGREVVRMQSNGYLGRRSRLCNEDAKRVLSKRLGTEYVRALKLGSTHAHNFTPAELSGLPGLRFLELHGGNFIGEFEDGCLSELQWLSWRDCALDFRGTNLYLENLVVLRFLESHITETWTGWKQFKTARNLKVLELEDLDLVTTTPDLSSFLGLERLVVHSSQSLLHIDASIANLECLDSLEIVNASIHPVYCNPNEVRQEVLQMPGSICNLKALSWLVIYGFKIEQLPENIGELKGLKVMKIRRCAFLRNLPDSIGDLESLCKLDLFHDGITELPESIGKLRNLTELDVRCNRLRRLPATIGDLDRLESLDASRNKYEEGYGITELPESIGKLRNLTTLNVSYNRLRSLPATIGDLERLETLDASHNSDLEGYGITELPESIGKLRNLTELDVSCNRLRSLPATIGDLERLEKLDAGYNKYQEGYGITELPESIGKLRNLTNLNVSNNRLRSLPSTIGDLERLEELHASHNNDLQGEIPDEFGKLQSLKFLNLSGTGIHGLPSSIVQLSCLESLLLLTCSEIQELPDLPTSLTRLEISSGSLKAVPDLSSLTNLGDLRLSNRDDDDGHPWDSTRVLSGNMMAGIHHLQKLEDSSVDLSPMPPYLSAGLDQLSRLRSLNLSCPNPPVVSLPSGLENLSLHHSTSLSSWEFLSNLVGLSSLSLSKSVAIEIRLDGLESLKNLTDFEIEECEFLERVHDVSRLQKLQCLTFFSCPKLVEIGGLAQPPGSLQYLEIRSCNSIQCLPRPSGTESPPSELHLTVEECSKLRDFYGPYDSYFQGGEMMGSIECIPIN